MFRIKVLFLLKTVIYNIIEQHENKEMALTYDSYTYRTKNATHRRCSVAGLCNAFLLSQFKNKFAPLKKKVKRRHWT